MTVLHIFSNDETLCGLDVDDSVREALNPDHASCIQCVRQHLRGEMSDLKDQLQGLHKQLGLLMMMVVENMDHPSTTLGLGIFNSMDDEDLMKNNLGTLQYHYYPGVEVSTTARTSPVVNVVSPHLNPSTLRLKKTDTGFLLLSDHSSLEYYVDAEEEEDFSGSLPSRWESL